MEHTKQHNSNNMELHCKATPDICSQFDPLNTLKNARYLFISVSLKMKITMESRQNTKKAVECIGDDSSHQIYILPKYPTRHTFLKNSFLFEKYYVFNVQGLKAGINKLFGLGHFASVKEGQADGR